MSNQVKSEDIRRIVYPIVARAAGVEVAEIADDKNMIRDLAMDSLSVLEVAVDLETHYAVEIEDEDLDNIQTVGDIIRYIKKRL